MKSPSMVALTRQSGVAESRPGPAGENRRGPVAARPGNPAAADPGTRAAADRPVPRLRAAIPRLRAAIPVLLGLLALAAGACASAARSEPSLAAGQPSGEPSAAPSGEPAAAPSGEPSGAPAPEATPSPAGGASSRLSAAEIEAIYRARQDSALRRFTEADVRFITGMIGHHAQALVMASLAPTHDAGPAVRTLTARILNAQRDEIATMQRWLRERGLRVPEVRIRGINLSIDGPEYALHMPGMLTREQLEELDRARGEEFDRLFLRYMIQHHQGAVAMVHDLFATDGAAQDRLVFKLASDIQVDQLTEIARMEQMLAALTNPRETR